jgi:Mg2+/Co2+ transporter CorB
VLATIVLGNTIANAAMVAIVLEWALNEGWSVGRTAVAAGGLLSFVLLGCEVVPKTLAVRASERWALWVAHPMSMAQKFSRPLRHLAQSFNQTILQIAVPSSAKSQPFLPDDVLSVNSATRNNNARSFCGPGCFIASG